jgi:hypothetical protein
MTRKTRISIFSAVVFLALGIATAAFAYTNTGPLYDSAYSPQIWNYGTGVGGVSGTTPADSLTIPTALYPGFEESALRDMGTCLECNLWTASPASLAWISTNSYGSLKATLGISNRFFSISGNLGSAVTNTSVSGEVLCGSTVEWTLANPACANATVSYNSNGYIQEGLPPGTLTTNYATFGVQYTSACATSITGSGVQFASDVAMNPSDASGAVSGKLACVSDFWTAWHTTVGFPTSGTFQYGSLLYHIFHMSTADCKNNEALAWGGTASAQAGLNCYIAYAVHNDLQGALEHTPGVPFTTQTASGIYTASPALTSSPNETFVNRVRSFVDGQADQYTQEWNCLLNPAYVSCPTTVPPPPPGGGGGDCINVPQPLDGELFNDYVARLRADGYSASSQTVIRLDDPFWSLYTPGSPVTLLAPYGVTGMAVLGGGITFMMYNNPAGTKKNWPATPPAFCPSTTEIDVYTAPASSTGGGGGGGVGSIDFSPITSISYGSAFPFGILTYINGIFVAGNCDSEVTCNTPPHFTITPPGGTPIFVDLTSTTWDSTYRAPVFDVIKFLIIACATWWFCWKIVGIGGGSEGGDEEE